MPLENKRPKFRAWQKAKTQRKIGKTGYFSDTVEDFESAKRPCFANM